MLAAGALVQVNLNTYLTLRRVVLITTDQLVRVVTSKHQIDTIGETRQVYFTANCDVILIGKSCVPLGAELYPET